jgi:ribosomal protein L31E
MAENTAAERIMTVPLRIATIEAPKQQRANTAIKFMKRFVKRHAKVSEVTISEALNSAIWKHSRERPPRKIKIKVSVKDGIAAAMLPDEIPAKPVAEKEAKTGVKQEEKKTEGRPHEKGEEHPAGHKEAVKEVKNEEKAKA